MKSVAHEIDRDRELDNLRNKKAQLEHKLAEKRSQKENANSDLSKSRLKAEIANLKEEIEDIEANLRLNKERMDKTAHSQRKDNLESKISKIEKEIEDINAVIEEEDLKNKRIELENLIEDNKQLEDQAQQISDKLSDLMSKKVGNSLGSDFEERKNNLDSSVDFWGKFTVGSIILLIAASGAIYWDIATSSSTGGLNALSKIALLLPISVAVWFSSANYRRERKLKEEYAFKSTLSTSLDGYRKVVQKELPDEHSDQLGQFLTESMLRIFSNPHENIANGQEEEGSGQGFYAEIAKRIASGSK
jgi:small-conductance mechanosensitive channel